MAKKKPKPRGPKPERLKVKGPLGAALTTFLKKKRPAGGWPTRTKTREPEPALAEEE
jgi:hypothetical protein